MAASRARLRETELLEQGHVRRRCGERDRRFLARDLDHQRWPGFEQREDARVRRARDLDVHRAIDLVCDRVAGQIEAGRSNAHPDLYVEA